MKSVTLHKLDDELASVLEERANRENVSMNQMIKSLLRGALGLDQQLVPDHRRDFEDLFDTWSKREAEAFEKRVGDCRQVRPDEW